MHMLDKLSYKTFWVHPRFSVGFVTRSLVLYVCFVDRCLSFVLFLLAIVLSVLLRYTYSDYPFGIFKLFLAVLWASWRSLLGAQNPRSERRVSDYSKPECWDYSKTERRVIDYSKPESLVTTNIQSQKIETI